MKKIIFLIISVFLFAVDEEYLDITNKLVNYQIKLENIANINPPFEIKRAPILNFAPKEEKRVVRKIIKIDLISIFNNKAYVLIREFLGEQLVKSTKKWLRVGDKIGKCRVKKITNDKLYLACPNKMLIKSLNKKIPFFKESK
jgi:hypothetical protein